MGKSHLHILVDEGIKKLAKEKARELGVPLGKLVEQFLASLTNIQVVNNNIIINSVINVQQQNNIIADVNKFVARNVVWILEDIRNTINSILKKSSTMWSSNERAAYLNNAFIHLRDRIDAFLRIIKETRFLENSEFQMYRD